MIHFNIYFEKTKQTNSNQNIHSMKKNVFTRVKFDKTSSGYVTDNSTVNSLSTQLLPYQFDYMYFVSEQSI